MALVALHHSSLDNAFFRLARLLIAIVPLYRTTMPFPWRQKQGRGYFPHPARTRTRERERYACDVTQWLPPLVVELLLQIGWTA